MSTRSRCEWSNLVLVKLVKLKGLESIQLDVVKVAGDAFLGFFRGDAAQTTNGKQPKIQPPSPTKNEKSTWHAVRIATSSKQRF